MASITWKTSTMFNDIATTPAIAMNDQNSIMSSYQSTYIPQPYYRSGEIMTDGPFAGSLFIQDKPTNGPENLGLNNSIGLANDNTFLSATQHLFPSGRLTYASGSKVGGPIKFSQHAVIGTDDKFSDPSVGQISPTRAIIAGTDYNNLGLTRQIYLVELSNNGGVWSQVGEEVNVVDGDNVSLAVNSQNVGVLLYDTRNLADQYFIRVGDVSQGIGTWSNAPVEVGPPPTGTSRFQIALNDAGYVVSSRVLNGLVTYRIGQVSGGAVNWISNDTALAQSYYDNNQFFEMPTNAAVAINNNYAILLITTYAAKYKQYRLYYVWGELVP
jgi:hypothetical protein